MSEPAPDVVPDPVVPTPDPVSEMTIPEPRTAPDPCCEAPSGLTRWIVLGGLVVLLVIVISAQRAAAREGERRGR